MSNKKKRKKLRVAFRKNRERRSRAGKIDPDLIEQGLEADEQLAGGERMTGKGDLSRHRTVMVEEGEGETPVLEIDEENCLSGRVIAATGLNTLVQTDDGRRYECTIRRVVRTIARDARNAVVTGDRVMFLPTDDATGVIERVEPRSSTISRGSQRHEHIIVANVDRVVIVVSADEPPLKPGLIDRMLVSAEKGDVEPIICINKIDLVDPAALQPIAGLYARLGYTMVLTSATREETGNGVRQLRRLLKGHESVFAGHSGVGKSSLLNAIDPDWNLQTGSISEWSQKGKHTTRRAILLPLECGGWVVDTPGVRQFELWDVIPEEVEGFFVEFRPFVAMCKFPDCSHTHEAGCGVKRAVQNGLISEGRYASYLSIVEGDEA